MSKVFLVGGPHGGNHIEAGNGKHLTVPFQHPTIINLDGSIIPGHFDEFLYRFIEFGTPTGRIRVAVPADWPHDEAPMKALEWLIERAERPL